MFTSSPFLKNMASVDTSWLISSTCRFPKLSDQSESVLHLFLLAYWLRVLPFPISKAMGEDLGIIGRQFVSFKLSKGNVNSPPVLP
jgi:hypothetical protein